MRLHHHVVSPARPGLSRRLATTAAATALATLLGLGAGLARAQAPAPDTDGEVTKIDKAQAKLTLRHAEIKSLDMPPMTMVFKVADPAWLERLAVGDKVRFAAAKVNGAYTVTALSKAP